MKHINYTTYIRRIHIFPINCWDFQKNCCILLRSPFWLVQTNTVDWTMSSRFFWIHQVCRRIPIPPYSTKPYCPFWVKRTPAPSTVIQPLGGQKTVQAFFKGSQKKTLPLKLTGKKHLEIWWFSKLDPNACFQGLLLLVSGSVIIFINHPNKVTFFRRSVFSVGKKLRFFADLFGCTGRPAPSLKKNIKMF